MKITERIDLHFDSLSTRQKKAAHYIASNLVEIVTLPARQIAELANVSEATLHRLAQALDYANYKDMHGAIKEAVFKQRAISRLQQTADISDSSWVDAHYDAEIHNIEATRRLNDYSDLQKAADMLLQANKIWVAGWRMGLAVTSFSGFIFKYLLGNAELIPQGQTAEYATYLDKRDVMFISGFPRYCRRTLKLAEIARQRGLRVIVLTDSKMSPFVKYGDVNLYALTKSVSFLDSYTAPLALVNAILREMSIHDKNRMQESMKTMEHMFEAFEESFSWSIVGKTDKEQ